MDFFDHQDRARRKTLLLVIYFSLAVIGVVLAVYVAAVAILTFVQSRSGDSVIIDFWHPQLFLAVTASVIAVIATGSFYKIIQLGSGGEHVALSLGGKKVPSNTRDLSERILLNVVEEMALASGTPVPPVYLMEDEPGINAFAAGTTPQNAVIGITRGALDTLKRDELQGVIAHEFSHILNGDMRLNIRLMGLLHGILVLALIGYMILRIFFNGSSSSRRSSSSSDNKKGEGALIFAILAVAISLIVIGYVGVFFAQLIKSAVSRQREYLADASAVQFTRNPPGIADALKKIGGWPKSSKVIAPRAEESSHLFFGSAMVASLFSTHPPLIQRILRIEPQFQGSFPAVSEVRHDPSEIIDPQSLSLKRASLQQAHISALAGAEHLQQKPSDVVESIGEPRSAHIEHAHELVDALEPALDQDIRDPLGAVAVIYGLLLASPNAPIRKKQLDLLASSPDQRPLQELQRILPVVDRLQIEQRLPVACMALPALHQMSPPQIQNFYLMVRQLIQFDQNVTIFEYAVHRYIAKRLLPRLKRTTKPQEGNLGLSSLKSEFAVVLTFLARIGDPDRASQAFRAGLASLGNSTADWTLAGSEKSSLQELDLALDRLALASPKYKKQMLSAFAACIAEDQHVSIEETELLRVIADALGCPVPPVLKD